MSKIEPQTDKLQCIFDNAKVGIAIFNAVDNRLEMVNPAFAHIHGYEPHELIGVSPVEVFAPECMLRLSEHENISACAINDVSFETTHTKKDGSTVPVAVHITVIKDENGIIKQRIANIIDISARKEAESKFKMTSDRYAQIFDNSIDPIYLVDVTPDGRFIHLEANPAFENVTGIPKEEIIGRYVDEIEDADFRDILLRKYGSCLQARGKVNFISEYNFPIGKKTFHSTLSPIFDKTGRLYQISGIARDITEQKQIESELESREQGFRSLAENTPDNIARWDIEGRYLYINPVHEQTLGKTAAEVIGTFIPDAHIEVKNAVEQVATGEDITVSQSVLTKDGSVEYHEVRIVPERDTSGNIISVLGIGRNITERKKLETEIIKQKDFQKTLLLSVAEVGLGVHVIENGKYIYTNDIQKAKNYGYDETIFDVKPNFLDTIHPDDRAKALDMHTRRLRGEDVPNTYELAVIQTDGTKKEHNVSVIVVPNTDPIQTIVVAHDISERKQMEEKISKNEHRLKEAQKIAKFGSWELDFSTVTLTWSDEIYRIFEVEQTFQPTYELFFNAVHPDDRNSVNAAFTDSLNNKTHYDIVHRLLMSDGRIKYVHERGETTYDAEGNPLRTVGTAQDVSERKSVEKKMEHMAHHDALTGLSNRTLAKARTEQIIASAKRAGTKVAILFIDLDGFKAINDTLGHSAGDAMLKTIASRLKECTRESDIISRQGGDEFLLILSDIKETKFIASTAEKVLKELEKPVEISGNTLSLSGSIGIALYPDHGETFESLLRSADTAMYKAKELGKNSYHFYTQQMTHNMIGQFKIQNDLKNALNNNEFVLFYQPQIDLMRNHIIGVEALIRWRHPLLGMMPPMSFIPIAENTGLIVQIGQWVIEEACRQVALWQKMGIEITVAVNISALQFKRGNLEEIVKNALLSSKINPKWLELELTESIIMHDADNTLQSVRNLKALGIQLSLDDFGTGYSSLAYLKRFAVDKLKIDQSFVRDILQDREDAAIVKTIIQMAKNLNLKTIAEGVEDANVLAVIDAYGCDEVQGYHFAKPMPSAEFEHYFINF